MASDRPNILLITSDQHHYDVLGATNSRVSTPALDRLCREGTRFSRAYCPNPTCTPTRASIITGLYPSQHGAWTLGTGLYPEVPTIGDALQEAGYYTGLIGKAHFQPLASGAGLQSIECQPVLRDLDFWRNFAGPWYGFRHVETARMHACEHLVGGHYAVWMEEQGLANWRDYFRPWPHDDAWNDDRYASRTWDLPEEYHYTTWTGERTVAAMREAAAEGSPFFIWSSFHDPHPPYLAPEPWAGMYDPAEMEPDGLFPGEHERNPEHFQHALDADASWWERANAGEGAVHGGHPQRRDPDELRKDLACYYGMVSFLDAQVGRILAEVDRLGLTGETLVVFSTDHGHFLGQHGLTAKAIHMYEDLIRIPFIVRWPGRVPAGEVSPALQNLVDLAPTFRRLAGLPDDGRMTGIDQLDAWQGGGSARTWSVTENHHGYRRFHMRTLVNERYKLTVYRTGDDGELFDLESDPGEICNLWHEPDAQPLKGRLLHEFMQATLQYEHERMPRIAGA